jgi:hypothetical protein
LTSTITSQKSESIDAVEPEILSDIPSLAHMQRTLNEEKEEKPTVRSLKTGRRRKINPFIPGGLIDAVHGITNLVINSNV